MEPAAVRSLAPLHFAPLRTARLAGNYSPTHPKLRDQRVNCGSDTLANKKKRQFQLGWVRLVASQGSSPVAFFVREWDIFPCLELKKNCNFCYVITKPLQCLAVMSSSLICVRFYHRNKNSIESASKKLNEDGLSSP